MIDVTQTQIFLERNLLGYDVHHITGPSYGAGSLFTVTKKRNLEFATPLLTVRWDTGVQIVEGLPEHLQEAAQQAGMRARFKERVVPDQSALLDVLQIVQHHTRREYLGFDVLPWGGIDIIEKITGTRLPLFTIERKGEAYREAWIEMRSGELKELTEVVEEHLVDSGYTINP